MMASADTGQFFVIGVNNKERWSVHTCLMCKHNTLIITFLNTFLRLYGLLLLLLQCCQHIHKKYINMCKSNFLFQAIFSLVIFYYDIIGAGESSKPSLNLSHQQLSLNMNSLYVQTGESAGRRHVATEANRLTLGILRNKTALWAINKWKKELQGTILALSDLSLSLYLHSVSHFVLGHTHTWPSFRSTIVPPPQSPCWPALTLLQPQLGLSPVTSCTYVSKLCACARAWAIYHADAHFFLLCQGQERVQCYHQVSFSGRQITKLVVQVRYNKLSQGLICLTDHDIL